MFNSALQLTLREMRVLFTSPRTLATLVVVGAILGMVGPFSTFEHFRPAPRLAYWIFIVIFCYPAGSFGGRLAVNYMSLRFNNPNPILRTVLGGVSAGIPVAITVIVANSAILGNWEFDGFSGMMTAIYCILISICVAALHSIFARQKDQVSPAAPVPIMARLDVQNRGTLFYMSMQDHYINVVTSRGAQLLLLRMGDAEKETAGIQGVRIHRSHWAALEGIKSVQRQNGNYVVEMLDGEKLPVSRGQLKAARDAGIIPN